MRMLDQWTRAFSEHLSPTAVVGVGMTAFMRVLPAHFYRNYHVLSYRASKDIALLRARSGVFSLEEADPTAVLSARNTTGLLEQPACKEYLRGLGMPLSILVYKSAPTIEAIVDAEGWGLVGNRQDVRRAFEHKAEFPRFLAEAGIDPIPYEIVPLAMLRTELPRLHRTFGPRLVFQLVEHEHGGGMTTFFLTTEAELRNFETQVQKLDTKRVSKDMPPLTVVKVAPFINAISASVAGCVTDRGVLSTPLQIQIVDRPEVIRPEKGAGLFVGHDWFGGMFSAAAEAKAADIARRFGAVMAAHGYKGIYGMDVLVDPVTDDVYPVECNSRYTGAFPMLSFLHLRNQVAPLDAYHLAEFLDVRTEWDLATAQEELARPLQGSHIILSNKETQPMRVRGDLAAGVYRLEHGNLVFMRPGYDYEAIQAPGEFVITDGVPYVGAVIPASDELARICHLLAIDNLTDRGGELTDWAREVIAALYAGFDLERVASSE